MKNTDFTNTGFICWGHFLAIRKLYGMNSFDHCLPQHVDYKISLSPVLPSVLNADTMWLLGLVCRVD